MDHILKAILLGAMLTLQFDGTSAHEPQSPIVPPISWRDSGNASVASRFQGSEVILTVTKRLAGAIDSLRWNGKEFINSYGHGRQLQSAAHFNGWDDCFMPTEAGSKADGRGPHSTSRLIDLNVHGNTLTTITNMAFWVPPGSLTSECRRYSGPHIEKRLSGIILTKKVTLGVEGIENAIDHVVTYKVPSAFETAVFEALAAYMPPDFSEFWTFNPATGTRARLSDGPGGQPLPIVFSTPSQAYAFGVYSAELPQREHPHIGYVRWRFAHLEGPGNATVKWNCVFHEKNISPGDYSYRCTSVFGTLSDVEKTMIELHRIRGRKPP